MSLRSPSENNEENLIPLTGGVHPSATRKWEVTVYASLYYNVLFIGWFLFH